jgi:hypothetical protein
VLLCSILAGSVLVYLASAPNVYSEDLAWSVALACASLFALVGVVECPSWGRVVTSGILVLLTNLNRSTTVYAAVLATLLIALWFASGRAGERRRWAVPMALAAFVALTIGCVVNMASSARRSGPPSRTNCCSRGWGSRTSTGDISSTFGISQPGSKPT